MNYYFKATNSRIRINADFEICFIFDENSNFIEFKGENIREFVAKDKNVKSSTVKRLLLFKKCF